MPVRRKLTGLGAAVGAAAFLGALSTIGDQVWACCIPDGAVVPGVVHGVVVFIALALALGWCAGRPGATRFLLLRLPLAGLVIAGLFYPLAYLFGYLPALIISWALMWLTLAVLLDRARADREADAVVIGRALAAASASGLVFWAISGIWTGPSAEATNLLVRFLQWTFAFLPGFSALLLRREERSPPV